MRTFLFLLVFGLAAKVSGQNVTLSGRITDAKTGEELIGANVFVKELKTGAVTNSYGFYSLSIPKGTYSFVFSYTGYTDLTETIELKANLQKDIELKEDQKVLKEVLISGERVDKNITENKMSVVSIDVNTVRKIPILLGEVDIIKALQLMPGVQAAGDGSTLTVVRGGNIDHNLVLLDEAVVYNPTHVIGFFSVFNGDAVKDFELYKGGIPSQYGGRLASVLDVRMRDGNTKNLSVSGGIGLLSSRLTLEGPVIKDKASFIVSGRRSYFDIFFPLSEQADGAIAYFGDLNAKINFKLSDKDRLYISAYYGQDNLGFGDGIFGFGWGNTTTTARWNHIFNSKWFSNASLIYSRYNYRFDINIAKNLNFQRLNYIDDIGAKYDVTYYASPKSSVKMGLFNTYHIFQPGVVTPITSESLIKADSLPTKRAFSQAYYVSHKYDLNARINVEYGARLSLFSNLGTGREFVYENNEITRFVNGSVIPGNITDTLFYNNNGIYNTFYGLEPRLNILYKLNAKSSIKASYNRMYQYMHLIQNIVASTGQEFWTPSTPNIKPQRADQVAIGYFRNFLNDQLEASVETYYKGMNNTVELIDNANIDFNEAIESQIVAGIGRSYGAEFLVRKDKGRFTGWVSYTLSKSERKADNINNNEWYDFRFDRRHYFTVVASYDFTERLNVSSSFIYSTGNAYTAPIAQYELEGKRVALYSERNANRIPEYHRMDLSLTYKTRQKPNARLKNEGSWVLSIFNLYGRKNVYTLEFRQDPDTGETAAYMTYLTRVVPSITYNFKF